MNAEIIGVGSELLLGQIANTNAQFLSKQLASLGVNVYYHTVVGDNPKRLETAIEAAKERADLLVFTGGLGPTKDDLTKETVAKSLGRSLVSHEESLSSIKDYFVKTKRVMTPNNEKQALVVEGSDVLLNDHGMAPGMYIEADGKTYIMLPGPPKEMKPMFENYAKSHILDRLGVKDQIISRVLRFFAIGESQLETEIEDLLEAQSNPTIAPLAGDGEVTLRLTAKHETEEGALALLKEIEDKIQERVGEYFYGYDQTTLFSEALKKLGEKNWTLASAESLTGGLFSERMTSISGSGEHMRGSIVTYHDNIKEHVLGVDTDVLQKHGAISEQCARQMAEKIKEKFNTSVGISFTGVAGPNTAEGHPVGHVFVGLAIEGKETVVHELNLQGTREGIRKRTVNYGAYYLLKEDSEL
ncbi:competence/damage-inducible protein A [Priestia filamentosa]|uniref:Putative competence-damage inducible protein n=1 Tax=Priestia filamentosa TaxID=1402861 RepID=A0A1X7D7E8_9BACI|nr:competence/damage-inducible protein A [Priestia filamentosa]AKO93778.1 competence/damage-inducible protein A [Priestia filamentosa]MDT3764014.1 competence/damage-inducible protein A [Priestia filamentosa]OXS71510.1 competence/damage-inducible protein A [Priestia filamentosa]RJS67154.1 competence/damage-inducible protein A [Priestia filamentosa]WCM14651.1 competence/damage-inducible protein A [Priestia filamentosa]